MDMAPDEAVVSYRQAKNKANQLKILADLNDCTVDEIINVLCEYGDYKPQFFNKAKGKLKKQETAPITTDSKAISEPPESNKLPPVVKRAIDYGIADLIEMVDARRNRIEELKAEIAEFEKDIAALRAWEEEHT